ncbi:MULTISPECIES: sugar ABC transporter permease [Mesotoga]|uniref:Permease component of ABC-type sugar transporter n=1 Tax=Mesotoga prima MesG1.Ag.4.2 TaxID=660470 RepID=I2F3M8_9BACT|nr:MULTISPECIES: sugar ABC transporter permease [Mesotoga]MCP5456831.1 sugar ABC transporter permease [Thermotogota bacterium]CCU86071.1 Binding-protein-dependent transport systems inner membrane component [Mesotoga infera]AFK06531.1 permease component of ABC-type sugar transporter [Mesotoga prima MesG1.Ag.4.2]MCP5461008.1 sugar ABC transporter permease [Thermotogota bacterium]RLL87888.1 sugar ABC transporter permease [Mesotoga sp. H07pep.5.4]
MPYSRRSKKYWKETWKAYLFLLPSIIILGVFVFWPIGFSLVLSFFKWDYTSTTRYFIGFDNYKELFRLTYPVSLSFVNSLMNTVVYVVIVLVVVQLIYYLLGLMSKYDKTDKSHSFLYVIFIALLSGYVLLRNTSIGLTTIGLFAGLGLMGFGLYVLLRRKSSIQSRRMKSSQWSTLILFIVVYYVFAYQILTQSADFVQYFTLAKESSDFLKSIYNTVYYVLLSVPTQIALALIIAMLLNKNIKLRSLFRTAYFIPFVTSVVAVSLVWQWMFNDQFGLLNYILSIFNLPRIAWLKDEVWTIPTIAIVSVWQHVGYTTVIFLAGLQNIDKSYYEAADVDGASGWQKFKFITWPLLSGTTFFIMIITMIGSFKVFSQIFILYQGLPGPVNKSGLTLVYYVFDAFYNQQRMGVASAAAYVLFMIILVLTMVQLNVGKKRVHYEG